MNILDAFGWTCGVIGGVFLVVALVAWVGSKIEGLFSGDGLLDRPKSCGRKRR